jgi:hypothetical protein
VRHRPADVGQPSGQVDPDAFVAETRRRDEIDERMPLGGGEPGLFLELACGGDVRRLAAIVEQSCRQFPQSPADRMAVLIDQDDVGVVIHREHGNRTEVLDHLSACGVAAGHAHLIGTQRENISDVKGFGG